LATYVVKRLLLMMVTLFGITLITFAVTRLTPGEPLPIGPGVTAEQGGFDAILEANRRNLGLDKPMFLNLRFEDRDFAAREAVADICRPVRFWREDAERRMRRSGTIALGPALERLRALEKVEGPVDHWMQPTEDPARRVDVADARRRLLAELPRLAGEAPSSVAGLQGEELLAAWEKWFEESQPRWTEQAVRTAVESFLSGSTDESVIRLAGAYTVPYLMRALNGRDDVRAQRANSALSALTGFTFVTSAEEWAAEKPEVIQSWNSFYTRERVRFSSYNSLQHALNMFVNTQYGLWLTQLATLDFGTSYKERRPVISLIIDRLPITFILSVISILLGYLIALPIGIYSAVSRNPILDRAITVGVYLLYSLPVFWVAQLLLMTMTGGPAPWGGEWPRIFPTRGLNSGDLNWMSGNPAALLDFSWHIVLPVLCMTYGGIAYVSRQMRSAMLENLNLDYVRTARAKGLAPSLVIYKHVLRNSLIPILTISASLLPELMAGSIVVELIFTIPGMGLLTFDAILNRDYPVINAVLFFSALLTLLGILLVDLSYALADPRIRYE
jgi:peptide/nickel transport system permease protein